MTGHLAVAAVYCGAVGGVPENWLTVVALVGVSRWLLAANPLCGSVLPGTALVSARLLPSAGRWLQSSRRPGTVLSRRAETG